MNSNSESNNNSYQNKNDIDPHKARNDNCNETYENMENICNEENNPKLVSNKEIQENNLLNQTEQLNIGKEDSDSIKNELIKEENENKPGDETDMKAKDCEDPNNVENTFDFKMSEEDILVLLEKATQIKNFANNHYSKKEYLEALNLYIDSIQKIIPEYNDEIPPYHFSSKNLDARLTEQLSIIFMNRGLCYKNLNENDRAIDMFSKSLVFDPKRIKALYHRISLLYKKGEYLEVYEDYLKLEEIDNMNYCKDFLKENNVKKYELKAKADQKKEQMTGQMMGQLKDVANSVLDIFGLSTNNFQFDKTEGGGYNIKFVNQ